MLRFIGGGNRSTGRKPPIATCCKWLTNLSHDVVSPCAGFELSTVVVICYTTKTTTNWATRTPLKTGNDFKCSSRISTSPSTSGTRRVTRVTNPEISHEWWKDCVVTTTHGTYTWSTVTQIFRSREPSHGDDVNQTTSNHSLKAATLNQGNRGSTM